MTASATSTCFLIDGDHPAQSLQELREHLKDVDGQAILDLSAVHRVDPDALMAIESLLQAADDRSLRIVVRGVNVSVYKVLKLARLASRVSFDR